jgi:hypothetical protein
VAAVRTGAVGVADVRAHDAGAGRNGLSFVEII